MAAKALIQTRIDPTLKEKAATVLEDLGLTLSEAIRIFLAKTVKQGGLPFTLGNHSVAHDAWFGQKMQEALDDTRPALPHDEVEAHFAKRREAALGKAAEGKA